MAFWKINTNNKPEKVAVTKLRNEQILEKHLENWIKSDPDILGEPLLIIGQQVIIPEIKDRLDLLALDTDGKAVIIELKRGKIADPVDMQALRYASYISKWSYEDFENLGKSLIADNDEFNLQEVFGEFCFKYGVDEIPDVNSDQRVIIVGSEVKERLGSVSLWLYEHNIDIKVIEIDSYKEGESLLLQPRVIIPQEVNKFSEVGKTTKADMGKPWLNNGKSWHLEKRMKSGTKEMYILLDKIIRENTNVSDPVFDQKAYISYKIGNYNWLTVETLPYMLIIRVFIKAKSMDAASIAKQLDVQVFDRDESLAEKVNLPTSVLVRNLSDNASRVVLRIKEEFDLLKPSFAEFLRESYKNFAKG